MKWVALALLVLVCIGLFIGLEKLLKHLHRKNVERRIKDILYIHAKYKIIRLSNRVYLIMDGKKYRI